MAARTLLLVTVAAALLAVTCAKVKNVEESPKGQTCCHFPKTLGGLAPFTSAWLDECPRVCPSYNATARALGGTPATARRYCYRGSEKSGTSITLLLLHELVNRVAPLTGWAVQHDGSKWQESLGFEAVYYDDNNTVLLRARRAGPYYKHANSVSPDCHLILSMRDPRDMVVSWWHHKHRIQKEPVPENWVSRGPIPGFAYNPQAFYRGSNRYMSAKIVDRNKHAGFLPLTFKAVTQDMGGTLYQLAEYFKMDVYNSKVKDKVAAVVHDLRTLYDRSHAWDLIKKYEETGEVAPKSDWFGVTHFNSGRVGDYLKELTAADVAALDGYMCSAFPMQAGLWGASNCTADDTVKSTLMARTGPPTKQF